MKPIRIFRHIDCEGPGYLASFLTERDIPWELVALDQGAPVPRNLDDVSGLVFMGGPMSVNDDLPWIREEITLIQGAAGRKLPVLGHCLGGQLIAKALGARVEHNPVREIGWFAVSRLDGPAVQDWLGGLPERLVAFHWHGETFSIPGGAAPLLKSRWCPHQAFATDNILALQCHVEMTASLVREWTDRYSEEIAAPTASVQSALQINEDLEGRVAALNAFARGLYQRWLRPVLALAGAPRRLQESLEPQAPAPTPRPPRTARRRRER